MRAVVVDALIYSTSRQNCVIYPPMKTSIYFLLLKFLLFSVSAMFCGSLYADVVKPALVEINVDENGSVDIEIRASIEALLSGINAKYKNTADAPTAEKYDQFRKMSPADLRKVFTAFSPELLKHLELWSSSTSLLSSLGASAEPKRVLLSVSKVKIPLPGYTKVPRISVIRLSGQLSDQAVALQWYYPYKFGDNAVRVRQVDKVNEQWHWSQWQWLKDDQKSDFFSLEEIYAKPSALKIIIDYVVLGFEHIVPKGLDHILFILGIFLLSVRLKFLLSQVTMFTLAHTITLGLSMNGLISLPASVVEPLIALSIAYVGLENVFAHSLHKSRLFLVFGFGLLHGLGFAGVLSDFGMPKDDFVKALISFNVGVELGQLSVISLAYLSIGYWFGKKPYYHTRIVIPASLCISVVALYWTAERIFEF